MQTEMKMTKASEKVRNYIKKYIRYFANNGQPAISLLYYTRRSLMHRISWARIVLEYKKILPTGQIPGTLKNYPVFTDYLTYFLLYEIKNADVDRNVRNLLVNLNLRPVR